MSLVKRHPLIAFFVLAWALSWWPWILYAFGLSPTPIASFGPFGPRYKGQMHALSITRTPFQTVS